MNKYLLKCNEILINFKMSSDSPKGGSRPASSDPIDGSISRRSKRPHSCRTETSSNVHNDERYKVRKL
jgi:hypothetical protein